MPELQPTLHKPVPMGARVRTPKHYLGEDKIGTVEGIAFRHIVFVYIVRLDEPIQTEYGEQRAIVIPGSELEGLDGTNWRIEVENLRCQPL